MKFYISARYGRRLEAEELGRVLLEEGHEITSRWIWRDQPDDYETATHEEVADYAEEDIEDVMNAEALITLSEPSNNPYGRGGRHVEFGFALGMGKELYVIGPLENIFHYMDNVVVSETVADFLEYLREG